MMMGIPKPVALAGGFRRHIPLAKPSHAIGMTPNRLDDTSNAMQSKASHNSNRVTLEKQSDVLVRYSNRIK